MNEETEGRYCLCGCEGEPKPKRNYLPGHDARHASLVGRNAADRFSHGGFRPWLGVTYLPTPALEAKALGLATRKVAADPDSPYRWVAQAKLSKGLTLGNANVRALVAKSHAILSYRGAGWERDFSNLAASAGRKMAPHACWSTENVWVAAEILDLEGWSPQTVTMRYS